MSSFKHPQLRYKILDKCFRNTARRYFMEDLIRECERALVQIDANAGHVSRRQIFDDITFMESDAGWKINLERIKDGKRTYYRYFDPAFSIFKMPLTEADLLQLQSAIQMLSHFEGMPQFSWLDEMVTRLQYYLPENVEREVYISFDNNPFLQGIERLSDFFYAIKYRKVLQITYQDFNASKPYVLTIHPYFLKQYNNRWFLLGLNYEAAQPNWVLALDRIKGFQELANISYVPSTINWNEYFDDMIGVSRKSDAKVSDVILHIYGSSRNYVRTKAIHGSQKLRILSQEILEVRLKIIINYELEQTLLSFGENLTVIEPLCLAEKICSRHHLALKKYSR